ncbi:hypothetical protein ANN_16238 [Periplaneta americana]|uniref:Uncharacterized protein n=1 Tax=Periplaneta americana TaxID=6978 RepID=A0ABQ8SJ74_PERAM|nr:hypothetical protein ANN_16238 [Periplaneta americana]
MSPGSSTESYPAFAHIGLRENPGKNLNQVTCPDRESNPGHLVSQPDALTVNPQNLPLPAASEVRGSSSGVTPWIFMKNDGVLHHQVSSFSPESWTKVVVLHAVSENILVHYDLVPHQF